MWSRYTAVMVIRVPELLLYRPDQDAPVMGTRPDTRLRESHQIRPEQAGQPGG